MRVAVIKNGICINMIECESVELAEEVTQEMCLEAIEGYNINDIYKDGIWYHPFDLLTPSQKREQMYKTHPIIDWEEGMLTVDEANELYFKYVAEKNAKAEELSTLIANAKTQIREMYPDEK